MSNKKFEYKVLIKESHLDSFGHVNNAAYLSLFEEARWDFITNGGYGLEAIQARQKGPVVLEANLRFKRELKNREQIRIESFTESFSGKIMRMTQRMIKEGGEIACEAAFVFGFMDLEKRKLIEPPEDWKEAVGVE